MYLGSYNGRRVDKMSQKELLEYASEAYYFNVRRMLKDRAPFAYEEFTREYQYIVMAIDKCIQQHTEYKYFDDDFYYWKCYRNKLDYLKSQLDFFAKEELDFYNSYIHSLSNKDFFLQIPTTKKQIKLFQEELEKGILFADFAYKSFPFLKPQHRNKWEQENAYYRAVFYKAFIESDKTEYPFTIHNNLYSVLQTRRFDDLARINFLYSLYHNEELGITNYTLYYLPPKDQYEELIGLTTSAKNSFITQHIAITEQSSHHEIELSSCICITAELFLSKKGRWQSVKSFMEHTAKSLFPNGDSAEVHMHEYGYVDFRNKGYVQIGEQTYPFEAEWLNSAPIDEKTKIKHLKIYIMPPNYSFMGREVEYVSELIEQHDPTRLLSSVLSDLSGIRIGHKGGCPNPNKAIMLLALHQAIRKGLITSNTIYALDQLESLFFEMWNRYVTSHIEYKPLFEDTLYRLKAEPFWNLIMKNGNVDNNKLSTKQINKNDFTSRYDSIILEYIHFVVLSSDAVAEVVSDILLRLFDSKEVKFYQSLGEIITKNRKEQETQSVLNPEINKTRIVNAPYPIPSGTTNIEPHAYENRKDIIDLVIPDGVESIGNLAFSCCENLRSISFPNSLIKIGNGAFKNCSNLQSVSFGNKLKILGISSFSRCRMLQTLTLPRSLRYIGARAFCLCSSLQKVIIPNKVYGTGDRSFAFCTSLTDMIISEGVSQIDNESFLGCSSLSKATIPASIHWVGSNPFSQTALQCLAYAEGNDTCYLNPYTRIPSLVKIEIPASCTYISTPFVLSVIKPQEIVIQNGNKTYAYIDGVLYNTKYKELVYCRKDLQSVAVLQNTRSIGTYAFSHCEQLQELSLPDSIVKIDSKAFIKCKKLKKVFVPNERVSDIVKKEIKCQIIIRTN